MLFVFGSNLSGIHGAGAALHAYRLHGAAIGVATGRTGNAYAIPTKDKDIATTLPLGHIAVSVEDFKQYARDNPELSFQVTRIGCGLAGLKDEEIAPMFQDAPKNCFFDLAWRDYLPKETEYWGTF